MRYRKVVYLIAILHCCVCNGQTGVDELLNSKRVRNQIYLQKGNNVLNYRFDESGYTPKQMENKTLSVRASKDDSPIGIVIQFINPLRIKIIVNDEKETDPSYEAINSFFNSLNSLISQISTEEIESDIEDVGDASFAINKITSIGKEKDQHKKALEILKSMKHPKLAQWKYMFYKEQKYCLTSNKLLENVQELEQELYGENNNYSNEISGLLEQLINCESVNELSDAVKKVDKAIYQYKLNNAKVDKMIITLQGWDFLASFIDDDKECSLLREYSIGVISDFIQEMSQIQQKRKGTIEKLIELNKELLLFLKNYCDSSTDVIRLGIASMDYQNVIIKKIYFQERKISFKDGVISDEQSEGDKIELGKIRFRTHHTLIPEFGTGVFYSNLQYPKFGTKQENGETVVGDVTYDNYRFVLAAHLNLVFNTYGLANPMIQIGVGTSKLAPSLLAGGGLRFAQPRRFSISGGVLWTWRNELEGLKPGDKILGTSELEKHTKLKLMAKPAFYLGINLGIL